MSDLRLKFPTVDRLVGSEQFRAAEVELAELITRMAEVHAAVQMVAVMDALRLDDFEYSPLREDASALQVAIRDFAERVDIEFGRLMDAISSE